MRTLKRISHFVLYGVLFSLISGIVSLLTSDDYSLAPNEAFADVPAEGGGGSQNDGSSGCGCAGCGAGGSCGSGCAGDSDDG